MTQRKHPFKEILRSKREDWDRAGTPAHIRANFSKTSDCGTAALGAEVFASNAEIKVLYHTCKSRFCPSCGVRATQLWQQEIEAALPDTEYVNINLTMPDVLWSYFQEHPRLFHDLSGIAAQAIMAWAYSRHRVRLQVMVVPQTFGGLLNFHPHLHVLASAGGLREGGSEWIPRLQFDKEELMECWRFAVIAYLGRMVDLLDSDAERLKGILHLQYARRWNVFVSRSISKAQFVRYAGRYMRRPPIAESRLTRISGDEVEYIGKDTRGKQRVTMRFTNEAFLNRAGQHVPQHYSHGVRYFGLLAPRTKHVTAAGVLAILGLKRQPKPRRLGWATSVRTRFGTDPLIDNRGGRMRWIGRLQPSMDEVGSIPRYPNKADDEVGAHLPQTVRGNPAPGTAGGRLTSTGGWRDSIEGEPNEQQ